MGLFCRCPYTPPVDTMIYRPLPDDPWWALGYGLLLVTFAIVFIIAVWNMD